MLNVNVTVHKPYADCLALAQWVFLTLLLLHFCVALMKWLLGSEKILGNFCIGVAKFGLNFDHSFASNSKNIDELVESVSDRLKLEQAAFEKFRMFFFETTENARVLAEEFTFFGKQLEKRNVSNTACAVLRNKFEFLSREFSGLKERLVSREIETFVTVASRDDLGKLSSFLSKLWDDLAKRWKDFERGVSQSKEMTEKSAKGDEKSGATFGKSNGAQGCDSFYGAQAQTRTTKWKENVKRKESFSFVKIKSIVSEKYNLLQSAFGSILNNNTAGSSEANGPKDGGSETDMRMRLGREGISEANGPKDGGSETSYLTLRLRRERIQAKMSSFFRVPYAGMISRDTLRDELVNRDSPQNAGKKNRKSAPSKNENVTEMQKSVKGKENCSNIDDLYREGYCEMAFTGGSPEKLCGKGNTETDFMSAPFPKNNTFCKEKFDEAGPSQIEPNVASFVSKVSEFIAKQTEMNQEILRANHDQVKKIQENQDEIIQNLRDTQVAFAEKLSQLNSSFRVRQDSVRNVSKRGIKIRLKDLPKFDGKNGLEVTKFLQDFKRCCALSNCDEQEALVWLENCLSGLALREFNKSGPFDSLADAKHAILRRFLSHEKREHLLDQLRLIKQGENEHFSDYVERFLEVSDIVIERESRLIRYFITGLCSTDIALQASRAKCKSLEETIELIEEEQLFCLPSCSFQNDFETRKCYRCGVRGHIAEQCPDLA